MYVVAHLYYEQKLVREEIPRRLDVALVGIGGRIGEFHQHANVCAHYFDIEGGAPARCLEAGLIAIGREDLGRIPMAIGVAGG